MNPTLKAHMNFWSGAFLAAFIGWMACDATASMKAVIGAIFVPFLTSIVQQTRNNPLEDQTSAMLDRVKSAARMSVWLVLLVWMCGCTVVRIVTPFTEVEARVGRDAIVGIVIKGSNVMVNTISQANPKLAESISKGIAEGAVKGLKGGLP